MKIKGIRIRLFGKLVNEDIGPVNPGMTVVFGKNESGKTTLKEFIRTTLFRTRKRSGVYPQHSRNDSGELDCVTDDGKEFMITRKGLGSTSDIGKMPEELTGISPDVYQKVYAMDPEDLIDTELVASGDIKRRFLTIPGGENMPQISDNIDSEMNELLNDGRITYNKGIGEVFKKIEDVNEKIDESKSKGPEYERLTGLENEMEKDLEKLERIRTQRQEIIDLVNKHDYQKTQMESIAELTDKRKTMDDADKAPSDGLKRYNELNNKLKNSIDAKDKAERSYRSLEKGLEGINSEALAESGDRVIHLSENIGVYHSATRRKSEIEANVKETRTKIDGIINSNNLNDEIIQNADTGTETLSHAKDPLPKADVDYKLPLAAFVLGFLFTGIAAITGTLAVYAVGGILFVIGAVLIYKNISQDSVEDNFPEYIIERGFPEGTSRNDVIRLIPIIEEVRNLKKVEEEQAARLSEEAGTVQNLESELEEIVTAVGWSMTGFEEDVRRLRDVSKSIPQLAEYSESYKNAKKEYDAALSEMTEYLKPFENYENLERIVKLKKERDLLDERLNALKETLESYGVDPKTEIPEIPEDPRSDISQLQRNIGEIQRTKKDILNDNYTERLYNERSALEAELESLIREWGVLSLERTIVDRACDDIYDNMQPAVIQTADRYLEMMTEGEYRMYNDPRTDEVAVMTGTEVKTSDKWSSGLAGQVCLSLKLAVAKELSKETLPILLDDVLLVFDYERKKGACKALAEVAEEMQIMLFTCDRETHSLMSDVGAEILELHR